MRTAADELRERLETQQLSQAVTDITDAINADPTDPDAVDPVADMDMDVNEPAAAGPEDEPLGRAPVEV